MGRISKSGDAPYSIFQGIVGKERTSLTVSCPQRPWGECVPLMAETWRAPTMALRARARLDNATWSDLRDVEWPLMVVNFQC